MIHILSKVLFYSIIKYIQIYKYQLNISWTKVFDNFIGAFLSYMISSNPKVCYLSFMASTEGSIVFIWIWAMSLLLKYLA